MYDYGTYYEYVELTSTKWHSMTNWNYMCTQAQLMEQWTMHYVENHIILQQYVWTIKDYTHEQLEGWTISDFV